MKYKCLLIILFITIVLMSSAHALWIIVDDRDNKGRTIHVHFTQKKPDKTKGQEEPIRCNEKEWRAKIESKIHLPNARNKKMQTISFHGVIARKASFVKDFIKDLDEDYFAPSYGPIKIECSNSSVKKCFKKRIREAQKEKP